jgi:hypothetical protein
VCLREAAGVFDVASHLRVAGADSVGLAGLRRARAVSSIAKERMSAKERMNDGR